MRYAALLLLALALLSPLVNPATVAAAPQAQGESNVCVIAVQAALTKIEAPYVWGAKGPSSFDCSGLTYWAYQQAGIDIGLSTYDQQGTGTPIACTLADLAGSATICWQPGDLIFLRYPGGQHVALYAGSGLFADAYHPTTGVILHDPSSDSYYQAHFWQARRPTSCAGATVNPGTPSTRSAGSSPSIEAIADILPPIALQLPWACGTCATGQADLAALPFPDWSVSLLYPFQWFGVWLYNSLFLPLICWMLAIAQALLNALAYAFNGVLVAGVNLFWRLGVLALLWLRDMFLASWSFVGWLRLMLWSMYGAMLKLGDDLAQFAMLTDAVAVLVNQFFSDLGLLVVNIAQVLWYFVGLFMTLIPGTVTAVFSPTTPPELTSIQTFFIFQWIIDFLRAFADSKLGWVWVSFVGIVYLRFILWLLDELSTLNQ